jgi:hypothetical protein
VRRCIGPAVSGVAAADATDPTPPEPEAAARRRTPRRTGGLTVVLVATLVAAGLAVRSQRAFSAAEQASRVAERTSLVADANRLAELSRTVGSLDLSLLLAAEGFRVADTPETQDGLLTTLVAHRRAARAVPLPQGSGGGSLALAGDTLFVEAGGRQLVSWAVRSGSPHNTRGMSHRAGWRATDASPSGGVLVAMGFNGISGPWMWIIGTTGATHVPRIGNDIGGEPFGAAFTADGAMVDAFVATPAAGGATWHLVRIRPGDGARQGTGASGTMPAPVAALQAHVSDPVAAAVLWAAGDDAVPATLVDMATGHQLPLVPAPRDASVVAYRAQPSGSVAQLWDDGAVTLYDRTGRAVQQLAAHRGPVRDAVVAPDGTWAATVGDDGAVLRWDVDARTGRWSQREFLLGHAGAVLDAEIDPAGTRLFTLGTDDTVIAWDVTEDRGSRAVMSLPYPTDPAGWLREACGVAGRDLTRVEWDRFVPGRPYRATCSELG